MPPEIRTEIRRSPYHLVLGKDRLIMEREATIVTDLRDTPFGRYDFGHTTLGPIRWVRDSTPD